MKNLVLFILLPLVLLFGSGVIAQEWHTDIATAESEAALNSKLILLVFQGSDWCGPCIKLDKDIWSKELFRSFAKDNFVLLQADFPRRKKNALSDDRQRHNVLLADKYNPQGIFPLVVLLDRHGTVIGETGYKKMAVMEYLDHLKEIASL